MANSIAQKLKITGDSSLLAINGPQNFAKGLGDLPKGAKIISSGKDFSQVHWFVRDKAQMEKELPKVLKLVGDGVLCWVYYPKGSSKVQTDLTRDKGWEALLANKDLHWLTLISFDDTWSAFSFRKKSEKDKAKDAKPKERPIFDFVDPTTKSVRLPDDFAMLINKNKKAQDFFNTLSFSNKKEYIEWIVTAKREETRKERVQGTIDRLLKNWKNPRNI